MLEPAECRRSRCVRGRGPTPASGLAATAGRSGRSSRPLESRPAARTASAFLKNATARGQGPKDARTVTARRLAQIAWKLLAGEREGAKVFRGRNHFPRALPSKTEDRVGAVRRGPGSRPGISPLSRHGAVNRVAAASRSVIVECLWPTPRSAHRRRPRPILGPLPNASKIRAFFACTGIPRDGLRVWGLIPASASRLIVTARSEATKPSRWPATARCAHLVRTRIPDTTTGGRRRRERRRRDTGVARALPAAAGRLRRCP